jgi:hypothetical protein
MTGRTVKHDGDGLGNLLPELAAGVCETEPALGYLNLDFPLDGVSVAKALAILGSPLEVSYSKTSLTPMQMIHPPGAWLLREAIRFGFRSHRA